MFKANERKWPGVLAIVALLGIVIVQVWAQDAAPDTDQSTQSPCPTGPGPAPCITEPGDDCPDEEGIEEEDVCSPDPQFEGSDITNSKSSASDVIVCVGESVSFYTTIPTDTDMTTHRVRTVTRKFDPENNCTEILPPVYGEWVEEEPQSTEGGPINVVWSSTGGTITGSGASATFVAGATGTYTVTARFVDSTSDSDCRDEDVLRTVTVTVVRPNLIIQGLGEVEEDNPGAVICLNDDDDNKNYMEDRNETPMSGDNDLHAITVAFHGPQPTSGTLTLTPSSKLKIWMDAEKTEPATSINLAEVTLPIMIYVEGIEVSDANGDSSVVATCGEGTDSVTITVVDIDVVVQNLQEEVNGTPNEEDPGADFFINSDHDELEATADNEPRASDGQHQIFMGDDELSSGTIRIKPASALSLGVLKMNYSSSMILLWQRNNLGGYDQLLSGGSPTNATSTGTFSFTIEGIASSEMVPDVDIEGVFEATIGTGKCGDLVKGAVFEITEVKWSQMDSPLDANTYTKLDDPNKPKLDLDLRMFPGKTNPSDTKNRKLVEVVAQLKPAIIGRDITFASYDVDDPSSDVDPIDVDDTSPGVENADNRGTGNLLSTVAKTDLVGQARVTFEVSMHAGDSWRVAAFYNAARHTGLRGKKMDPLANIVESNDKVIPAENRTKVLTVWRRVHLEIDDMQKVVGNFALGNITRIRRQAGRAQANLDIDLTALPTGPDTSSNLNAAHFRGNGRFENGKVDIGTGTAAASTSSLHGNGSNFVQTQVGGTFDVSFSIKDAAGAVTTGKVTEMVRSGDSTLFFINASLSPGDFNGRTLSVAGVDFVVLLNSRRAFRVKGAASLPFKLYDDDDQNLLPTPGTDVLAAYGQARKALNEAFVDPQLAAEGSGDSVPFVLNASKAPFTSLIAPYWDTRADNAVDYWTAFVLFAYQASVTQDRDPNSPTESGIRGETITDVGGIVLYRETIRDFTESFNHVPGQTITITSGDKEIDTFVHELGHVIGTPTAALAGLPGHHPVTGFSISIFTDVFNGDASRIGYYVPLYIARIRDTKATGGGQ